MKKRLFSWFLFCLLLISCGRDNYEIPGEVIEEEPDPIEIEDVFIEGKVRNEFGLSLIDVKVLLYNQEGNVIETVTDVEGYFMFDEVDDLTEEFRLVCLKEDHHAGILSLDITALVDDESVEVILFSDGVGSGIPELNNPFDNDLVLINGKIDNYQADKGSIVFELVTDFSLYSSFGFTTFDGHFQLWVPQGQAFELMALDVCHNIVYQNTFDPVFEATDELLVIQIEDPQAGQKIIISGLVKDCISDLPIESGTLLFTSEQSFFQEVEIQNGAFEFEVYDCLIGNSLEIFPYQNIIVSSSIIIETEQFIGEDEWDLGDIKICDDQGGNVELLIDDTQYLEFSGVIGLRNESQILIFSEQFACGLTVNETNEIRFEFIQITPDPLNTYEFYASNQLNFETEVDIFPESAGDSLILNFEGEFVDQNTFSTKNISGSIEVMVF